MRYDLDILLTISDSPLTPYAGMSDTEYKRIFQLAKERALYGFSPLAQRMIKDADESVLLALPQTRSMLDQKALSSVRQVLLEQGSLFVRRMDAVFRTHLDRAMQTMYTDLRPDLATVSINELSLIDDETVSRQIEVDRLLIRMRDADPDNIGRLNIMVAQMHGNREARERENPFRPYLLARTLHEVLAEIAADEAQNKLLFEHLSNAMINNLSDYYTGVRGAFESSGIKARFIAQPSKAVRNQHYFGGLTSLPQGMPEALNAQAMSGLQHMLELLRSVPVAAPGSAWFPAHDRPAVTLQDRVRTIFTPAAPSRLAAHMAQAAAGTGETAHDGVFTPASKSLIAQLSRYQALAAEGKAIDEKLTPEENQLFALREQIGPDKAGDPERVMIDVIAMLFEFLLGDDRIPLALRNQLSRLQVPFLKAAMLDPALLQHAAHPARQLLNRMTSAAIGCDMSTSLGKVIADEITRVSKRIVEEFDTDAAIFADALAGFEQFLATHLHQGDDAIVRCADALSDAERSSMLLAHIGASLANLLAPLNADPRISAFITTVWARVLTQAQLRDATGVYPEYRDLLPELVWSVQDKSNPQERSALMRLLPVLVRKLKAGMALLRLSEEESRQALDQLVELHTEVLRSTPAVKPASPPTFDELRQRFSLLTIDGAELSGMEGQAVEVPAAAIEAALAERGITASLHLQAEKLMPIQEGAQFLAELHPGACMKYAAEDGDAMTRLVWISRARSLYLFTASRDAGPIVYTAAALLQTLLDGRLRPVEYAPVFDRAVESLLAGAESLNR
ncbi:DUF1631 family protein [Noviherbaspirillum cavernae]|uniref:DUF1631 family protein n=1 Tax=Noviherbaspirillum cavernae TaxID=2320862 RepID=UPI000E6BDEAA|nr:DUF1631 family protein [Noviherbaspirillum cavernae]